MFFGVPDTPDQSPFRPKQPSAVTPRQPRGTPPPHHAVNISGGSSFFTSGQHGDAYEAAELRREVTHLRIRLVYLDELLARAGVDLDMADETSRAVADARLAAERIEALEAALRDLEERNAALAGSVATLRADVAERDAALEARPTEVAVLRAQEEATMSTAALEEAKAELAKAAAARRELEDHFAAERASWAEQRATAEELRREEARTASAAVSSVEADRDHWRSECAVATERAAQLQAELDLAREEVTTLRTNRNTLTADLAEATERIRHASQRSDTLQVTLEQTEAAAARWRSATETILEEFCGAAGAEMPRLGDGFDAATFSATLGRDLQSKSANAAQITNGTLRRAFGHAIEDTNAVLLRCFDDIGGAIDRVTTRARRTQGRVQNASRQVVRQVATLRSDLREERDARRQDHQRQLLATLTRTGEVSCDRIEHVLRASLDDVRATVLNTNVLTGPFIDEIERTVRSAAKAVTRAADLARATGSSRSGSPLSGSSVAVAAGGRSSDAARLLDWGQETTKACENIVALLRTNLDQAERQEDLYTSSLERARSDLNAEVRNFRRALDRVLASQGQFSSEVGGSGEFRSGSPPVFRRTLSGASSQLPSPTALSMAPSGFLPPSYVHQLGS